MAGMNNFKINYAQQAKVFSNGR